MLDPLLEREGVSALVVDDLPISRKELSELMGDLGGPLYDPPRLLSSGLGERATDRQLWDRSGDLDLPPPALLGRLDESNS